MAVKEGSVLDVIMIKPSRYCDDGYPITRMRPLVPANTLAVLAVGDHVDILRRVMNDPGQESRHVFPSRTAVQTERD